MQWFVTQITPRTDLTYYFFVPASLNSEKDYSVLLNASVVCILRNATRQLWQIADMQLIKNLYWSSVLKLIKLTFQMQVFIVQREISQIQLL